MIKSTSALWCNKATVIGHCYRINVSWFKNKHQHLSSNSKWCSHSTLLFSCRLLIRAIPIVATFQGIIIASIYGKLDNSCIFVASFFFLSTDLMQTFSNELIPLRKKNKPQVIIFETTSRPPPLVSLLAVIHGYACVLIFYIFQNTCHGNKLNETSIFECDHTGPQAPQVGLPAQRWVTLGAQITFLTAEPCVLNVQLMGFADGGRKPSCHTAPHSLPSRPLLLIARSLPSLLPLMISWRNEALAQEEDWHTSSLPVFKPQQATSVMPVLMNCSHSHLIYELYIKPSHHHCTEPVW